MIGGSKNKNIIMLMIILLVLIGGLLAFGLLENFEADVVKINPPDENQLQPGEYCLMRKYIFLVCMEFSTIVESI